MTRSTGLPRSERLWPRAAVLPQPTCYLHEQPKNPPRPCPPKMWGRSFHAARVGHAEAPTESINLSSYAGALQSLGQERDVAERVRALGRRCRQRIRDDRQHHRAGSPAQRRRAKKKMTITRWAAARADWPEVTERLESTHKRTNHERGFGKHVSENPPDNGFRTFSQSARVFRTRNPANLDLAKAASPRSRKPPVSRHHIESATGFPYAYQEGISLFGPRCAGRSAGPRAPDDRASRRHRCPAPRRKPKRCRRGPAASSRPQHRVLPQRATLPRLLVLRTG
jgi:hypothetical protein